jgi:hypothetical protein
MNPFTPALAAHTLFAETANAQRFLVSTPLAGFSKPLHRLIRSPTSTSFRSTRRCFCDWC